MEMETDKAAAPVNSPIAGTVKSILVKKGDVVPVGGDLLVLSTDPVAPGAAAEKPAEPSGPKPKSAPPPPGGDKR